MRKKSSINRLVAPVQDFMDNQKSGGIVLMISVIIAMILANSPWAVGYFHFFEQEFALVFGEKFALRFDLYHWINDGLMAMFFFNVGLELKREVIAGELSTPRKAILPIIAAIGGMVFPAMIFLALNPTGVAHQGFGIPMATDIAFALGVLYLLGDRIPSSLKIFLISFAIFDDIGAVLVIAVFYTSDISLANLGIGLGAVVVMFVANKMGVRSILFYALLGISGVWVAFLLSGVHATIAAVLAAFTIPANVIFKEDAYTKRVKSKLDEFNELESIPESTLTDNQVHVLQEIKEDTNAALPPLQRIEHSLGPFVTFVVLPVFAFANAGVSFKGLDASTLFSTNIMLGVGIGLLVGKVIGIFGVTALLVKLKISSFPKGMNYKNLFGLGFVSAIGFTMSLFITSLAFTEYEHIFQAKIGIFTASIIGGVIGYILLSKFGKKTDE